MASLEELGLYHAASFEIAQKAFESIKRDYDPDTGRWPQPYHNQHHSFEVYDNAQLIAHAAYRNGNIDAKTIAIVALAAACHDRYYETGNQRNEEISAELTVADMDSYSIFTDDDKDAVGRYMLSTKVQSFFPKLIQSADMERDYAEGIVADADLANLGYFSTRFLRTALTYLKEINKLRQPVSIMKYLSDEQVLLANHDWYTAEARELFPNCLDNIKAVRNYMTLHAAQ